MDVVLRSGDELGDLEMLGKKKWSRDILLWSHSFFT